MTPPRVVGIPILLCVSHRANNENCTRVALRSSEDVFIDSSVVFKKTLDEVCIKERSRGSFRFQRYPHLSDLHGVLYTAELCHVD